LPRDCFLKTVNEWKKVREDEDEGVTDYWMTLKKDKLLEIQRESTSSHCVENSLWKRLWTWRKTDYAMKALQAFSCSNAGQTQNAETLTLRQLISWPRLKRGIWAKERRLLPSGPHSSVRPHSAALMCKIDNSVGWSYFLQIPITNPT